MRIAGADQIVLASYGRSSGFCVDPIEKKPLNHFLPGSSVLSFGTAGCNLACKFCQNWDISKAREADTLSGAASPEQLAQTAKRLGCRSIAFTYNDPVIFLEYAVDCAQAARAQGIHPVAVTAGYVSPEARREFYQYMDAANVDLKAFSEDFYKRICGAELGAVLDTLIYLKHETRVWFEITTLLIPDHNDSNAEIERGAIDLYRAVADEKAHANGQGVSIMLPSEQTRKDEVVGAGVDDQVVVDGKVAVDGRQHFVF